MARNLLLQPMVQLKMVGLTKLPSAKSSYSLRTKWLNESQIYTDSGRVESLLRKSNSEFTVVISEMNGQDHSPRSHVLTVGKTRMKLSRGWITKAREIYSTSMQLCGVRGNADAPEKSLFWQPRKGLTFVLTFESEQERNAAIVLSRKYAYDCNVTLAGPDD